MQEQSLELVKNTSLSHTNLQVRSATTTTIIYYWLAALLEHMGEGECFAHGHIDDSWGCWEGVTYSLSYSRLSEAGSNHCAFSHKPAFLICCRPCWMISLSPLPLLLPLHQYLFSLPGPDRWECSGIKASVFTILFTSFSTSPFGHARQRKNMSSSSSAYLGHLGFMWDNYPVGAI